MHSVGNQCFVCKVPTQQLLCSPQCFTSFGTTFYPNQTPQSKSSLPVRFFHMVDTGSLKKILEQQNHIWPSFIEAEDCVKPHNGTFVSSSFLNSNELFSNLHNLHVGMEDYKQTSIWTLKPHVGQHELFNYAGTCLNCRRNRPSVNYPWTLCPTYRNGQLQFYPFAFCSPGCAGTGAFFYNLGPDRHVDLAAFRDVFGVETPLNPFGGFVTQTSKVWDKLENAYSCVTEQGINLPITSLVFDVKNNT